MNHKRNVRINSQGFTVELSLSADHTSGEEGKSDLSLIENVSVKIKKVSLTEGFIADNRSANHTLSSENNDDASETCRWSISLIRN